MDGDIPSLQSSGVGARFVSSTDIDAAKARRDEQWKAAYARLGQEPPPQPTNEDAFDGRSLAEKLAANKIAKQEEWEEKSKLANQFRALEEDEIMFLDSIRERQEEEERQREQKDGADVMDFKKAVAARDQATNKPPPPVLSASAPATTPKPTAPKPILAKKDIKKSLKGVVVKKKGKAAPPPANVPPGASAEEKKEKRAADSEPKASSDDQPGAKRRKVDP
ncbi:hypothetical protein FIBSPDRAFT_945243 [Athelia psychrophila]|uniref:FAM192A/Fyv6 N-terminal domain-containing protein n=1 Tax=Athelia psychrophila TaxID=1759441 RepID=A0A166U1H6_9AGAM|nr:hypothetical protein FIBSPDRAFT_945243 [Fibularhizoctonia sp. CBS 109695]